jgi:2-iminobutanoate/2-iminopropanoate deaminase
MNDFTAMNEVYGKFFPGNPPARTTIQAARLPKDCQVEIDAIALE